MFLKQYKYKKSETCNAIPLQHFTFNGRAQHE